MRLLQLGKSSIQVPGPDGAPMAPLLDARAFVMPAPDETTAQVQALIERSARSFEGSGVFAELDRAAGAPRCGPTGGWGWVTALVMVDRTMGPDTPLTELAHLQTVRFALASRSGESGEAEARLRTLARFIWACEQGPLSRRLLAADCLDMLSLALREEIAARRVSPAQASRYLEVLAAARPATPWSIATDLERSAMERLAWGLVRQTGMEAEQVFGRAIGACGLEEREDIAEIVAGATKPERIDPIAALLSKALEVYAPMTRAQRRLAGAYIHPASVGDLLPCETHPVARFLTESWTWVEAWRDAIDASESRYQAVRLMLALEAHAGAHGGAYPVSLEALTPILLKTGTAGVPVDAFSGAGYGYRRVDDPSKDLFRRGYLLWTFGADGDDDQGREPADPSLLSRVMLGGAADPVDGDLVLNTPGR